MGLKQPSARQRVISFVVSTSLTVLAVWLLSLFVDLGSIPRQLGEADPVWLWIAVGLAVAFGLLATIHKWWLVLRFQAPSIRFREALFLRLGAAPLVVLMPLRAGEISTLLYLRRVHGLAYSKSLGTLLFDRAVNLGSLLLLGLFGAFASDALPLWIPAVGLLLVIVALIPGIPDRVVRLLRLHRTRLGPVLDNLLACFRSIPTPARIGLVAYGIAAQLGMSGLFAACVLAQGIDVPVLETLLLLSFVTIASNVQLTVGGVGTREAVLLVVFAGAASSEQLVAASALFMLLESFLPAAVGALLLLPFFHRIMTAAAPVSPLPAGEGPDPTDQPREETTDPVL